MSDCLEFVRLCWSRSIRGNHDKNVFGDSVTVVDARPGTVKCVMKIQSQHLNGAGNVHGGVIMTLVDDITWLALQSLGTPSIHTVSSNLSAEYTRPCGKLGDELHMTAEAVKKGRRLCFLRITFYLNGQICAYGSHTVAVVPTTKDRTGYFAEDGSHVPIAAGERSEAKL